MGYVLQAIISTQSVLEAHASDFAAAVVVPLNSGLALIPITNELLDEIGASGRSGHFYRFTSAVRDWLRIISSSAPAAYVEADFFGGVGGQGAVVWARGEEVLAPTHDAKAINIALRLLGVSRGTAHDEFEAVGLPRHRDTDDWLDDAVPKKHTA
ncbi:hypothetical protein [Verrucomicrobium sp. BvORR106]|uniref:hypothetical protein n=1 Tax=Verrucomicrobium sp. BvORR106 TaxID=1403819 RepID=UPI00056FCAA3|nr:hypothetical protein [Verrucomicrobium sp. BvORR106]